MSDTHQRPFGFWMASALVVGSMIGSGIFVLPAQLAPFGNTAITAWIVAIAGALTIAWVLAELARIRPDATGGVAICGEALGVLPGVLIGWSYWVSIWTVNAILALTAIRYLGVLAPMLTRTTTESVFWSTALLWLVTALNLGGAKAAGRFQTLTTALKLLPLLAVVAILVQLAATGGAFHPPPGPALAPATLTPAVTVAFFALIGFEAASIIAARVRDPERLVPLATLAGTTLTGLLYLLMCTGMIFALPATTIAASPAPIALFVESFWGRGAGVVVALFAAIASIGALNGWVLIMGDVPLGMARAGLLPAWIARTSRRDVPVTMLVVSSVLATLLLLSNVTRGAAGLLDLMLGITIAASLWFYVGACLTALRLGVARAAAACGLAFGLWTLWGTGLEALGYSIVLMATAVPLYFLRRPRLTPAAAAAQPATGP